MSFDEVNKSSSGNENPAGTDLREVPATTPEHQPKRPDSPVLNTNTGVTTGGPRPPSYGDDLGGTYRGLEHLIGNDASSKYIKRRLLGTGSFGSTWRVEDRETGGMFAAKVMDTEHMTPKDRGFVGNEVKCLQRCDHPNVIRHVMSAEVHGMLLIVMEFADGGDLYRQVKARQQGTRYFREHEILFIFVQLCLALDHIHTKRMMHRDIKTANVLLTTTGLVKLGDFGFSRQYEDSLSEPVGSTFCGTPYYLSPELWKRAPYSKKSEMWALGVVLYEIMALHRPFGGRNMEELVDNIVHARYDPLPTHFSPELRNIAFELLSLDSSKRPSMRQLFRHPYIRKNGFEHLRRSVEHHRKITSAVQSQLLSNIDLALSYTEDYAAAKVNPKHGSVKRHVQDVGWVDCKLVLTPKELQVFNSEKDTERVDLNTITSVCPIDATIANESCVFALKTQTGKAYWFKTQTNDENQDWLNALQNAIPF